MTRQSPAQVELLELVAEDEKRLAARSSRSRRRKKSGSAGGPSAAGGSPAGRASPSQPSAAAQAAAAEAAASGDAADDSAPSTPTKAEERPPVVDSSSAEASPREQTAVSEAATPQLQAGSPELSDHGDWEQQQQHEGQSHGEWEVQQRGRKSRRLPRTPGQDGTAASPSPLGASGSAAMELQPAGRAEAPPPPPPPQQPHSGEQLSAWATVVSGAASTPMHDPVVHPAAQAGQQAGSAAWPQLPHTRPQAAPPAVPLPQPVRLRAEPQQQPMAPGPRQPPPGFSQRFSHAMHQHPHPQPPATVSRRSSTEYSLWGEDASSRMPLSLSASRESLASVSDMSFGSPPLAGGLHAGCVGMAVGSHGAVGSGQLPAGCSLFTQQPGGPPLAAATPSLFQHFGQVAAAAAPGGPAKPAAVAGGTSPSAGDAFSLFSSFPAASRQQAHGGGSGAVSSPWSGAMPAGFAALFGGSGITGRGMAHTMLA